MGFSSAASSPLPSPPSKMKVWGAKRLRSWGSVSAREEKRKKALHAVGNLLGDGFESILALQILRKQREKKKDELLLHSRNFPVTKTGEKDGVGGVLHTEKLWPSNVLQE